MGIFDIERIAEKREEASKKRAADLEKQNAFISHSKMLEKQLKEFANQAIDEFVQAMNTFHMKGQIIYVVQKVDVFNKIVVEPVWAMLFASIELQGSGFEYPMSPEFKKKVKGFVTQPAWDGQTYGYISTTGETYISCMKSSPYNSVRGEKKLGSSSLYIPLSREKAIELMMKDIGLPSLSLYNREGIAGLDKAFEEQKKKIVSFLEKQLVP